MSAPLTDVQEPGFYSEIKESPSLFLTPGSVRVVGIIGTGKSTKPASDELVRTAHTFNTCASAVSSITSVQSDLVFRYPASSYVIGQGGSADLALVTLADLTGKTVKVTVDGQTEETCTFTLPASIADIAAQINTAMDDVSAEISVAGAVKYLCIYVSGTGFEGMSLTIGAGTANTILGLPASTRAKSIRWDPAATALGDQFAPQTAETYTVTTETPKTADDLKPKSFFGLRQVVAEYGDVSTSSTISLGAQAAFGNGASIVTCRQMDPAQMDNGPHKYSEMVAALLDMEAQDINLLVPMLPLDDDSGIGAEYMVHASKMSSKLERKERRVLLGVDEIDGRLDILGATDSWEALMASYDVALSSGLEAKRVQVVNPGRCLTTYKGTSIETDGTYVAACLAGRTVSAEFDEAEPMTRKTLSTINELILPELTRPEKNQLTSLGITVIEAKGSTITVRRSITADSSSIAGQEPSVVDALDRVASELRESLENRFVGSKIINTTNTAVEAATTQYLDRLVLEEIIAAYRYVKAERNSVEPRQFDVSFETSPIWPFLWGSLDISVSL